MKKIIKLLIIVILCTSVYFIYQNTKDTTYTITSIGDKLSLGINSYGIKDYSYVYYIKEELLKEKDKVIINEELSDKNQTVFNILSLLNNTSKIKRTLSETDLLIITLGYNDLLNELAQEENINEYNLNKIINNITSNYNKLLNEIKKYYHNKIIIVGYYSSTESDYYKDKAIRLLNKKIKDREDIIYIDTYYILNNKEKYFSNPNSYYPNRLAYKEIANKIIIKTLENK